MLSGIGGRRLNSGVQIGMTPPAASKREHSGMGGARRSSLKADTREVARIARGIERSLAKLTENQRVRVWHRESQTLRAARVQEHGPSAEFVRGCSDPARQALVQVMLDGGKGFVEMPSEVPLGVVSIGVPGVGHGKEKARFAVGEAVEVSAHGAPGDAIGVVVECDDSAGYVVRFPWGGPGLDAKIPVLIKGDKLRRLRLAPVLDGSATWQYAHPPGQEFQIRKGNPASPFSLRLWSQGEHDAWISSHSGGEMRTSTSSSSDGSSSSSSSDDDSSSDSGEGDKLDATRVQSKAQGAERVDNDIRSRKVEYEVGSTPLAPSGKPGTMLQSKQKVKMVTPSGRAPRKPPTAVQNYVHHEILGLRNRKPNMTQDEMVKLLTEQFEGLPDEERRPWNDRAQSSMQNYIARMELHRQQKEAIQVSLQDSTAGGTGQPSGSAFKVFKGAEGFVDEQNGVIGSGRALIKVMGRKQRKAHVLPGEVASIKRPISGFMEFSKATRSALSKDPKTQNMSFAELSKHVAQLWKELPESERQPYNDISLRNKAEYAKKKIEVKQAMRYSPAVTKVSVPGASNAAAISETTKRGKRTGRDLALQHEVGRRWEVLGDAAAGQNNAPGFEPVDIKSIKAGLISAGMDEDAYLLVVDAKRGGTGSEGEKAVQSGLEEFVLRPQREFPPEAPDWKAFLVHVAGFQNASIVLPGLRSSFPPSATMMGMVTPVVASAEGTKRRRTKD